LFSDACPTREVRKKTKSRGVVGGRRSGQETFPRA
jgi:hypothetical protein